MKKAVIIAILGVIMCVIMYMAYSWLHRLRHFDVPEAGFHMTFECTGRDEDDNRLFHINIDSTEVTTKKNFIEVSHRSVDMPNVAIVRLYDSIDNKIQLRDTIYVLDYNWDVKKIVAQDYNIVHVKRSDGDTLGMSDSTIFKAEHIVIIQMNAFLNSANICTEKKYIRTIGGFWEGLLWW